MKSNSARYLVGQGISGLWKNHMMTLASIGVLTACLLIVGFAVLLTENINQIVGYVESQNEMVAFMYKSGENEEFMEAVPNVDDVNHETALRIQQDFEMSGVTEDEFHQKLIDSGMTEDELKMLFGASSIADFEKPQGSSESSQAAEESTASTDSSSSDTSSSRRRMAAQTTPSLLLSLAFPSCIGMD